jgi:hypothetical protein
MANKPKRHVDILDSRTVVRAEELLDSRTEAHTVPRVMREGFLALRTELVRQRREKEMGYLDARAKKKKEKTSNGSHPAVTGLSIGGAKEVLDYVFQTGFEHDRQILGFLDLPFIDGAITALIATVAAWFHHHKK